MLFVSNSNAFVDLFFPPEIEFTVKVTFANECENLKIAEMINFAKILDRHQWGALRYLFSQLFKNTSETSGREQFPLKIIGSMLR